MLTFKWIFLFEILKSTNNYEENSIKKVPNFDMIIGKILRHLMNSLK